jgi:hypothetical protein
MAEARSFKLLKPFKPVELFKFRNVFIRLNGNGLNTA